MVTLTPGALEYAQKHVLHALVVAHDGRIVSETYGQGHDAATPHALYSGTKSFWGTTALIAQRQGLLRLDECVAETFPEWKRDPWKSQVTLRQLLQLTSGIGFGGLGAAVPTYAKALAVELKNEPGSVFTYGGIPLQVFGAVLARKLEKRRQTPHAYLRERILDPLGLRIGSWRKLKDGSEPLPTGAFVAASEWLKYGALLADGGTWRNAPLVPQSALQACFEGSAVNPRYGLTFWL